MMRFCFIFFLGLRLSLWSFSEVDYKEILELETRQFIKKNNAAGLSVYVFKAGLDLEKPFEKIFYTGQSRRSSNTALFEGALYRLGSLSKIFTLLGVLASENKGVIDLDEPLEKYFPKAFLVPSHSKGKPRVKDLLMDLSGLPAMPTIPMKSYQASETEIRSYFKNYTLPRAPGLKYEPSLLGYSCLAYMLARVEKKSFEILIKESVLEPLKLENTYFVPPLSKHSKICYGYKGISEVSKNQYERDASFFKPSCGYFTTIEDMGKLLCFFLRQKNTSLDPVLKQIYKIHSLFLDQQHQKISLGFKVVPISPNLPISCYQALADHEGFNHFFAFVPKMQCGVVVLSNSEYSVEPLGLKLLEELVK